MLTPQWIQPFLATFVISIIPVGMLLAMPLIGSVLRMFQGKSSTKAKGLPLNSIMCFAAGSLLADALNHLAEEAKQNDPRTVAIQTLVGIFVFFLIDRVSRLAGSHNQKRSSQSIGYLSLIADAVHNFTDGLAIAASFAKSIKSGVATTTAIFMHEIPHELGDYALLAKSGFSHAKIIQLQLLTAGAAFAGTAVGMAIESGELVSSVGHSWLLPVTCGGFLYLALCSILSEVMEDGNRNKTLSPIILDSIYFAAGIAMLQYLESNFEL
jgi:zinc transporter ZupT